MQSAIEHFMWGYQPHFRINQECVSRRVFQLLDQHFAPEVFLVGILAEEKKGGFPACVEPEQDYWAKSDAFNSALSLANEIREGYPERKLRHSHPLAQKWHDDSLKHRSIRDAIQHIIEGDPARPSEYSYFVSHPERVEGYLVSVVLGLQTMILREYPSLNKESVPIHELRSIAVPTSLIDAVIKAYLDKASGELRLPDPGLDSSELNAEEIIREGANRLMTGLAYRADSDPMGGWREFLSSCTNIARSYYEGAAGAGTIVLASKDHVSIRRVVQFESPPKLRVTKAARKLLQLGSQDLALHTNSDDVYGLVKVKGYQAAAEDLFSVKFLGYHHWQVLHGERILMEVKDGQPYLLRPPFDEGKPRKDLPRIFGKMTEKQIVRILALIREAAKERHGTILIVSKGAKRESKRLAGQSTPIAPKMLTPELLRSLTPIDGAVLLNPKGICYAVGVILDGMASKEGDPSRGARYNSAIRYVTSTKFPSLAIIFSEDGGVDFFPNLRPMIRRSEVDSALACLREFLAGESVSRRTYRIAMEWLEKNRFYLLPQHCSEINELIDSINKKFAAEDPMALPVIHSQFAPHPKMNSELYYEPE